MTDHSKEIDIVPMKDKEFQRFSEFIHTQCGIKMPSSKKTMLQSRLQKRLRILSLKTYTEYADYVFCPKGINEELHHMIDAVTTNKTDFFRENQHFEFLTKVALPELLQESKNVVAPNLKFWSAGCSTGEEPYTLGMVVADFLEKNQAFRYSILATDISTRVLEKAQAGIYHEEKVVLVPLIFKKKYLLRSKNKESQLVRVIPEIRSCVRFRRLNFMDHDFSLHESMNIIFCRNVIIYFDRKTQEEILQKICRYLVPGGYLFMGHSETLSGMNLPLKARMTSVYMRCGDAK